MLSGKIGFVNWVYVDPNSRERGVGVSLYQDFERKIRGRVPWLLAQVAGANPASLKLHTSGMKMTPRIEGLGTGDRITVYGKKL